VLLRSLALLPLVAPLAVAQQSLGMYWDDIRHVVVFDADTDVLLGSLLLSANDCSDCVLLADLSLGFAVNSTGQVWVIDLTTPSPTLASGTNPIPVSARGGDLALSPDQRYLIVTGNSPTPTSVVDLATRTEIGTYTFGIGVSSAEVASDGSVLASHFVSTSVRRLMLDGFGNLSDTGELLNTSSSPFNCIVAPGGQFGVAVLFLNARVVSFEIQGMTSVDEQLLVPILSGVGLALGPAGDALYTVSGLDPSVVVQRFGYDPSTGLIENDPVWTRALSGDPSCVSGGERLAVHPDGSKVYVSPFGSNALSILDTASGSVLGSLPAGGDIHGSVCVVQRSECFLVLGQGSGSAVFPSTGHTWTTQLGAVENAYPVTLEDGPSFPLPVPRSRAHASTPPTRVAERDVQVLLWNPSVFPANPEQWSSRLHVTLWSNGRVTADELGPRNGIELDIEVVTNPNGTRHLRFPFEIDGL